VCSAWTGLRISDASTLGRSEVVDGESRLRTEKNGAVVWLPVPTDLLEALNSVENPGDFYSLERQTQDDPPVGLPRPHADLLGAKNFDWVHRRSPAGGDVTGHQR